LDLPLDSSRIDLWCAFVSEVRDEALWSRYEALSSPQERARRARLRFERDRRRDRLTRALVRTVLSRYAPAAPEEWVFTSEERGRPRIAGPGPPLPIDFNISHSGDLVAVALAGDRVGIDVEDFLAREADVASLHRYFAPCERASLLELPPQARRRRFFELWTLKEAYLKARGAGLGLSLGSFAFDLTAAGAIALAFDSALGDSPERWRLWQLALRGQFLLAICAQRAPGRALRLRVREVVPLSREAQIEVPVERSSAP
jgi:4'-phosphopantetheinyl transferase